MMKKKSEGLRCQLYGNAVFCFNLLFYIKTLGNKQPKVKNLHLLVNIIKIN